MTIGNLLSKLSQARLTVKIINNNLVIMGDKKKLTQSLQDEINLFKEELKIHEGEIVPKEISKNVPFCLSYAQQRLWFVHELIPNNCAYNISSVIHLKGKLDIKKLESALYFFINKHQALRTSFKMVENYIIPYVRESVSFNLDFSDFIAKDCTIEDKLIKDIYKDIATYKFNLLEFPLWKHKLIRLKNDYCILVISIHHIISDGWSGALGLKEIGDIYSCLCLNKEIRLDNKLIKYTDFSLWQKKLLTNNLVKATARFWKQNLEGYIDAVNFPHDYERPKNQTLDGSKHSFNLKGNKVEKLRRFAKKYNITLYNIFNVALSTLIYKFTDQKKFVIGTAISDRTHSDLYSVFGFLVNWLPIKSDFTNKQNYIDLLMQSKKNLIDSMANQYISFDQLIAELNISRDSSMHPLFQIMLVFHVPPKNIKFHDLSCEIEPLFTQSSKLDLTLFVTDTNNSQLLSNGDGIFLDFEYNTNLFSGVMIKKLSESLLIILDDMLDEGCLYKLNLLNKNEYQKVIFDFNATDIKYTNKSITEQFSMQVIKYPNNIAIKQNDISMSYFELNERVEALSKKIEIYGVMIGICIGVYLSRSVDLIIAILCILKHKAVYLPIDIHMPHSRMDYILSDANPRLILTNNKLAMKLNKYKFDILYTDCEMPKLQDDSKVIKQSIVNIKNIDPIMDSSYIIYTSGSTGNPKGVVCTNQNINNFICWLNQTLKIKPSDKVLQRAPISVDASLREIISPLVAGACLVLAPEMKFIEGSIIKELLISYKITILHMVPSLLFNLLEHLDSELNDLQQVVCGGEALSENTRKLFHRKINAKLYNVYGPTETTIDSTYWMSCKEMINKSNYAPIGKPISNTKVYILDENLNPLPLGIPGEIYISGSGVSAGYLNNNNATLNNFLTNPFFTGNNNIIYKTGDRGFYLPNGDIYYIGRTDRQVKIRGNRIELLEIESAINSFKNVKCSTVVVTGEKNLGLSNLIAYVVNIKPYISPKKISQYLNTLTNHLSKILPTYMLPSNIIITDCIPLTLGGKIDYQLLSREMSFKIQNAKTEESNFKSQLESEIAAIYAEVLNKNDVSRNDDFFRLGGHSLLATQIVSRIKIKLEYNITIRDLIEFPIVHKLANHIKKLNKNNNVSNKIMKYPRLIKK